MNNIRTLVRLESRMNDHKSHQQFHRAARSNDTALRAVSFQGLILLNACGAMFTHLQHKADL